MADVAASASGAIADGTPANARVSGAMVVGLVEAAKSNAMARELAGERVLPGSLLWTLTRRSTPAVRENTGLHHGYAVAEWCHRHNVRDVTIEPIRHVDPPA